MKDRIITKLMQHRLGRLFVKAVKKIKRKVCFWKKMQYALDEQNEADWANRDTLNPVYPIPVVITTEKIKRLNLVTDTIEPGSLLGGVATALIVATVFCEKNDYELRIITRTAPASAVNYKRVIEQNQLKAPKKVTFFSDYGDHRGFEAKYKMDISEEDIFFATSWWSAESIRKTTLRPRFFYIIQEVETFFYNYCGERLLCEKVMQNQNIDFIINSHYLDEYFRENDPNIAKNSVYFEPAFSRNLFHSADRSDNQPAQGKHRMFFYGRPKNPRNLFNYGVSVLDKAIQRGIIDTNEWEICFAGAFMDNPITFCDGSRAAMIGQMSWKEYAEFLRTIDLALCLMYTPHPSYPPFDVACSGGVVVTNRYMNKQEFPQCKNVLMADLTDESMLTAMEEGIQLALNSELRRKNYEQTTIPGSWEETLKDTLRFMEDKAR